MRFGALLVPICELKCECGKLYNEVECGGRAVKIVVPA